jgi:serine/threonine protein kinase
MLSGGKLFDEGMYGCIFTPSLECKNKSEKYVTDDENQSSVSKLILKDEAISEYSISKVIQQIPLWKNYFIVSESMCEPAPVQKDKELYECDMLESHKLSEFRILTMPFGGTPMNLFRFNLQKFNFMDFVIHLIEAGAILNLFGIVHRDIHQGNILIDNDYVPRIIDFNLAIRVVSIIKDKNLQHSYNFSTGQEPPDSTLVNAISLGYKYNNIIDSIIEKKPILRKIRHILGTSSTIERESLENFYLNSKSVKSGDNVKWFNTYWRTIDSWAIGVNIIDLISKLILWPEFTPILKKISPKLFPVLKKLCDVSPVHRIDCVQALKYLAPNSFIIRKYSRDWLAKVGDGNII